MKRIHFLVLLMVFFLPGCGGGGNSPPQPQVTPAVIEDVYNDDGSFYIESSNTYVAHLSVNLTSGDAKIEYILLKVTDEIGNTCYEWSTSPHNYGPDNIPTNSSYALPVDVYWVTPLPPGHHTFKIDVAVKDVTGQDSNTVVLTVGI